MRLPLPHTLTQGGLVQLITANVEKVKRFYAQEFSHIMDEEAIDDSLQYSKELENKIGRKMPECLHMWLRDAADCDTVRMSGEEGELRSGLSDGFSEKMGTLKREMVRIHRYLYGGNLGNLFCVVLHLRSCIFGTT